MQKIHQGTYYQRISDKYSKLKVMAPEKTSLYQEAIDLLTRINSELKDADIIKTINVKMVGVVKDLNDIMVKEIIGLEE